MSDFGIGPTLRDFCPWLRDDAERHRRILEVTEHDSVIEGLPPFDAEIRRRITEQLKAIDRLSPSAVQLAESVMALEEGLADVAAGRTVPMDQVFRELDERYRVPR